MTSTKERSASHADRAGRADEGLDRAVENVEAAARRVVDTLAEISTDAGDRLGDIAGTAGDAVREADQALRASSDQTLTIVGTFSIGMAVGLLMGGAHRLLVTMALVPAALVAGAALERMDRSQRTARPQVH